MDKGPDKYFGFSALPCGGDALDRYGLGQAELKHPCVWLFHRQPGYEFAEFSAASTLG